MTRFEFNPDKKKSSRNQFMGSWSESGCRLIDLPFSKLSMVKVLTCGIESNAENYSHQEIAHWCERYHMLGIEQELEGVEIALDVSAQWDLFLANTYTLEQLQNLDFSKVRLPTEWFVKWHQATDT